MKRILALIFLCLAAFQPVPTSSPSPEAAQQTAQAAVADVLDALALGDFKRLAAHVGGEGLAITPYVFLGPDAIRLSRLDVEGCASSTRKRLWGYKDGSGDPIETTCGRYFKEFVWNADYRKADEVLYNEPRQRGNERNNNHEFAQGGIVVELHIRGKNPNPAQDWKSLRLIFRGGEQGLSLIAITRDVWTI